MSIKEKVILLHDLNDLQNDVKGYRQKTFSFFFSKMFKNTESVRDLIKFDIFSLLYLNLSN